MITLVVLAVLRLVSRIVILFVSLEIIVVVLHVLRNETVNLILLVALSRLILSIETHAAVQNFQRYLLFCHDIFVLDSEGVDDLHCLGHLHET